MNLEEVQVATYLRNHSDFLEEWLARNADQALRDSVRKKWAASEEHAVTSTASIEASTSASTPRAADVDPETPAASASVINNVPAATSNRKSPEAAPEVTTTTSEAEGEHDPEEDDTLSREPSPSVVPRTGRKSVTSDLFHQWLASGSSSSAVGTSGTSGTFSVAGGRPQQPFRLGEREQATKHFPHSQCISKRPTTTNTGLSQYTQCSACWLLCTLSFLKLSVPESELSLLKPSAALFLLLWRPHNYKEALFGFHCFKKRLVYFCLKM